MVAMLLCKLDIIIGTITMAAMMASIPMEVRILEESSRVIPSNPSITR